VATALSLSRLAAPTEPVQGSRITEARQALDYWSGRAAELPWHRRTARREARMMIATHRAQLIVARLERWGLGTVARGLAPLLDTRGRSGTGLVELRLDAPPADTPAGTRSRLAEGDRQQSSVEAPG